MKAPPNSSGAGSDTVPVTGGTRKQPARGSASAAGITSSSAGNAAKVAAKSKGKGKGKAPARSVGGRRRPSPLPEASCAASSAAELKQRIADRKNILFANAVGTGGGKVMEVKKLLAPYLCPKNQRPKDKDGIEFPGPVDYEGVLMLEHLIVKEGRNPRLSTAKARKKAQNLITSPLFGAMFCDPAGSGKTAITWMFLTLLKAKNHIGDTKPVLLIAPGSNGSVREQWWDEYLLVHPDGPDGDGKRMTAIRELNLCWIDTQKFDEEPDNEFLDNDPGSNVKKADVYLLSEKQFITHEDKLISWIKAKNFQLVVIDEAHGCGTTQRGKRGTPSTLSTRVKSLYTKLPSVQILLISSDPGWEQTGNEALFREAIGLTGVHTLENRVVQRPLADFNMPKIDTAYFPRIEATQDEYDRILAASPKSSTVSKLRKEGGAQPNVNVQKNVKELATTLSFAMQADLLADHVTRDDDSTEQWAIWAISAHENKVRLRKMLIGRDIKCSDIYNDRGADPIKPEEFARKIQQDKTLQVIFPPQSHERGINLYTNVQNCVFWDKSDAQWTTKDRRSQIESRHARRNTVHQQVKRWMFEYAPNHPRQALLKVKTRKEAGYSIRLGPIREKAMETLRKKLATAGAGPADFSSTASSSSSSTAAAVPGPAAAAALTPTASAASGKRKRSVSSAASSSSSAAAVPGPTATAAPPPTTSAASGKRKRSVGEFPKVRDFLRTANLEGYYDDLIEAGFESLEGIQQDVTDEDLQDLGMTPIGHRKRLLRLAAQL